MSRPNGEPGGFGSSGVFLTRRGASERADDYVALLFSKFGGFCAGRSGEISLSPPSDTRFWGGRWEFVG